MKKLLLLIIFMSSFSYAQTDCTSSNIGVYDSKGALVSSHTQTYKANTEAIKLSQKEGRAVVKTPDIVCITKVSSSSSGISSSSISSSSYSSSSASSSNASTGAVLLSRLNLSSGLPTGNGSDKWSFGALAGASITVANDGTHIYLRGQYPTDTSSDKSGNNYIYGGYTPPNDQQDIYVQFYARMPGVKHGLKLIKFFGRNSTGGSNTVANATFGLDYTGNDMGSFQYVAYGDGSGQSNDTQNGIALYSPNWISPGRTGALTRTITPNPKIGTFSSAMWGTGWHKIQMRLRQNSGTSAANEVNDGYVELIIDGILYAKGQNIFNRHYTNGFIETIGLFGYTRGQSSAFEVHIRDVTVSTGGYVD